MRLARAAALAVLLMTPTLSACTAGGSSPAPVNIAENFATDPAPQPPMEQYASGKLSFGDPAKAGYSAVTDLPIEPSAASGAAAIPDPGAILASLPAVQAKKGTELLSAVDPIDQTPAAGTVPTARDGQTRNDLGELLTLDEPGSRACGNVEIAIHALDAGDATSAKTHLDGAVAAARESSTVKGWAEPLSTVDLGGNVAVLVGFLRACTAGGYEL